MKKLLLLVYTSIIFNGCVNDYIDRSGSGSEIVKIESIPSEMTAAEFIQYVRSDDYSALESVEIGYLKAAFRYLPLNYNALMDAGPDCNWKQLDSLKSVLHGGVYFNLELSNSNNLDSPGTQKKIVVNDSFIDYLGFRIQNDLKLVKGQDTLPCVMSHFVNEYQLKGQLIVMSVFEAELKEDFKLIWNGNYLLKEQKIFSFVRHDIDNINSIKLNLKF